MSPIHSIYTKHTNRTRKSIEDLLKLTSVIQNFCLNYKYDKFSIRIKEAVYNVITRAHRIEHLAGAELSLAPLNIDNRYDRLDIPSIQEDIAAIRNKLDKRHMDEVKSTLTLNIDDSWYADKLKIKFTDVFAI